MPVAGLGRMRSQQGGLGRRRRRFAMGGGPEADPGMTAEQEAEAVARTLHEAAITNAGLNAFPEQNRTIEEQLQEGPKAIAAGELYNNAGYQASLAESQVGTDPLRYGAGPPYADSPQRYDGPPPMEAGADWNYSSGVAPANWHDFNSNNTTTGGGYFNFEELFHGQGRQVPQAFQAGSNLPSTNNYRILPPDFRQPGYIMRNGQIIDMNGPTMHGPWGTSDSMSGDAPSWRSGAGVGYPVAFARSPIDTAISGWPGAFGFSIHSMGGN